MKRYFYYAMVAMTGAILSASATAKNLNLPFAPPTPDATEQQLDATMAANLIGKKRSWGNLAVRMGADLKSEQISRSDTFGYIFRYDVYTVLKQYQNVRAHTILVVSTKDLITYKVASY